jgi:chemotaxis protein methyltransferase CheR
MDGTTFNKFRALVYENSGIVLGEGKEALVCARIGKRMRSLDIPDHRAYLRYIEQDDSREEIVQLLDVISTNVTHFFREQAHFDFIQETTKDWISRGQSRLRLWSAACSTGEEPYSLAITLHEALGGRGADIKILATDISTRVLDQARKGIYNEEKLKNISAARRKRFFRESPDGEAAAFTVKDELRKPIVFRRLNLAAPPFPMHGPLDIVLCRNVMIYFDNKVRSQLLAEAYRLLKPGGYLIVGHAESLAGMMSDFKPVKPSIYIKA